MTDPKATSIMILGGPDAGKSNYIGAVWMRLRRNNGRYRIPFEPDNIEYVEGIVSHLRKGHFPPRTEPDEGDATFIATLSLESDPKTPVATITVPDMIGEIWKVASKQREIEQVWIEQLRASEAAMLFVRFGSLENVDMPDWITSAAMMRHQAELDAEDAEAVEDAEPDLDQVEPQRGEPGAVDAASTDTAEKNTTPTQVFLSDLLNLLEEHLGQDTAAQRPRVALMIAAWDAAGPERATGPQNFIRTEYPMLHGRIADRGRLQIRVFGVSATGYNLKDDDERAAYLQVGPAEAGFAEADGEEGVLKGDLLTPLAWALDRENE